MILISAVRLIAFARLRLASLLSRVDFCGVILKFMDLFQGVILFICSDYPLSSARGVQGVYEGEFVLAGGR